MPKGKMAACTRLQLLVGKNPVQIWNRQLSGAKIRRKRRLMNPPAIIYKGTTMREWPFYSVTANFDYPKPQGEQVEYPPVKERFPPGKWGCIEDRKAWGMYETGQELLQEPNVPGRLVKLASKEERFVYKLPIWQYEHGLLEFFQYITKTHLIKGSLPQVYSSVTDEEDTFSLIKPLVLDAILQEHSQVVQYGRPTYPIKHRTPLQQRLKKERESLCQIVNVIKTVLTPKRPHMLSVLQDRDVRVEAYWMRTGYDVKEENGYLNTGFKGPKGYDKATKAVKFQATHTADVFISASEPLPEFINREDPLCTNGEVPNFNYNPMTVGMHTAPNKPSFVPGYNPGSVCGFAYLSINMPGNHITEDALSDPGDMTEIALHTGIGASFTQLVAQAHHLGFSMYHDLTYPLTCQTIVSDGRRFSFFAYQLNTLEQWKSDDVAPLRNICWTLNDLTLYDTIEDGEVKGFNDDVLKTLIQFFLITPEPRNHVLRPYLPEDYEAPERKEMFIEYYYRRQKQVVKEEPEFEF